MAKTLSDLYIMYHAFDAPTFKSLLDAACEDNTHLNHLRRDGLLDFNQSLLHLLDSCGI